MATLVLAAAGSIIGGPIGGAIGAAVGQRIDQEIFKPKGHRGPRLNELAVQTSSYGSAIPKLFGTMRVAGTVIWATDLREERKKSGGGKGRPSTTTYSYSASFAVLLSARSIRAVRRIWADGNLLRGSAGDFKTPTGFRLHLGGEDQAIDPLIASAEGMANSPAYRGHAYVVFENLALGDYGNRIPSLSFEVEADDGPVTIGGIVDAIAGPATCSAMRMLGGFAATGDSVRGVIESLSLMTPLSLTAADDMLALADTPDMALPILEGDLLSGGQRGSVSVASALVVPADLSVSYYEPERDYQAGLQRARRPGPGRRGERIEVPAALSAAEAKAIAEVSLARAWTERQMRVARTPWTRIDLQPGRVVAIDGETGLWRIAARSLERFAVELQLVRHRSASALTLAATPGRATAQPDREHGPTVIHLLDIPPLGDDLPSGPRLFIAAAGPSPGWRSAALLTSLDGVRWDPLGATAAPAIMGTAATKIGEAAAALIDSANAVEVQLLHDEMLLQDADDAGLVAGANLALLGDELIQFGRATPLGEARWRLERLTRGRRGTEWAIDGHAVGERFVLIEADSLCAFDVSSAALGGIAHVLATGVGDLDTGAGAETTIAGAVVRPPSPVALRAAARADGGFDLSWTRRSRAGWGWTDGGEAPLAEEREAYAIRFVRGDGSIRTVESSAAAYLYPASYVMDDAEFGSSVTVEVAQIGSVALSRATALTISI